MTPQDSDVTTLTRRQLFDRVWETPGSKLASEFGVSDVGLAKICKRHQIPRPPRGYWAKLSHGKRVRRARLPDLDDEALQEIRIFRQGFFGGSDTVTDATETPPKIEVPE